MIHNNKEEFVKILERATKKKEFLLPLLEKDYYLTLILSRTHKFCDDLIFKGGTCLHKIYGSTLLKGEPSRGSEGLRLRSGRVLSLSKGEANRGITIGRLSEDLDFSMRLPRYEATRGERRKCIQPVKDNIKKFVEQFGMKIDESTNPGRNESKQYVYYFVYQSALRPIEARIKFEIGLRFNPIASIEKRQVQHHFLHPFTGEPLFDGGKVACLSLNELVSEKLRAGAIREKIAPRDFYDLDFLLRNQFDLGNRDVMELFKKKLAEDGADTDLSKYRVNLGRSDAEIDDMRSRIKEELFEVLTPKDRENFDLDAALERINKAMEGMK